MILWACIREKKLRTYFWVICESTDIQFGGRSIPNHSGKKTVIQVLKELGYSDSVVMLITRHKSQKGLAAYERLKTVMQQEGINRFFRALMVVNNGEGSYKGNFLERILKILCIFFFFLKNEALSAKTDHAKNLVRGFKRASSIISLASELAGDIDGL
ncbi:hypothetical protein C2G38_452940 [Gigaspora rosea]|uniref:Uncharacterized protein n=1 Tax=Gigaspora rosea TaxID=44941 RepID=A0A397W6C5_9GLOM|nr:hypothetical protein C2G38_452940 [Gigaspora rosea]